MATIEAIRRIVMEAQSKGFDKVAADLTNITKAQQGVVASSETVTQSTRSTEQAFARTERQLDKTKVAYEAFAKSVKAVTDAQAQGVSGATPQRSAEIISLAEQRLRKATGTTAEFAQSTGLARHELINLGRQVQDVGVSLAGGQSPLLVLAQQGSQIADVFMSSRTTVSSALAQIAGMAVRILPLAAALAAVATALYSVNRAAEQGREARIATTSGLGRLSGVSAGQVEGLAEQGRTPGMSTGEAREGVLEFIKAGGQATTVTEGLALATRVAATRGVELGDAYKLLAGIIRDPIQAARQLDAEYDILTEAQKRNIATMQANGDKAGAARAVFKALEGSLVSASDATTVWARAWTAVKDAASGAADAAARAVGAGPPPSSAQQLRDMQEARRARERADERQQQRRAEAEAGTLVDEPLIRPFFAPPRTRPMDPLDPDRRDREPSTVSDADLEAFKREQVMHENILELARKQTAEYLRQKSHLADINKTIGDAKQQLEDELRTAQALTTEEKATAAATAERNALTRQGGVPKEVIDAKSNLAGQRVTGQATAEAQQALAVQQQQIDMYGRLADAARMQGLAGVEVNAQLQMEMQLRQAGLNVMTTENQARIANAGTLAVQATQLRDIAAAQEIRAAGADQVQLINLETATIGMNATARTRLISIMQGEIQARALERQGLQAEANATRESTRAVADATAQREKANKAEEERNRQRQAVKGILEGQQTELENVKLEIELVGASARARAEATEAMKAEQQIRQAGISLYGAEAEAIRDNARELGRLKGDLAQKQENQKPITLPLASNLQIAMANATYGQGNYEIKGTGGGNPITGYKYGAVIVPTRAYVEQQAEQQRTARTGLLQSNIGFASSALQKQIQSLNEAQNKAGDIRSKIDQAEQKRQQTIQTELAAGVSPTQQNADIYYDPVKRKLYAESIAKDTTSILQEQEKRAIAEAEAAQKQVDLLQDQMEQLQNMNDLISAGVDLTGAELASLKSLIGVVRSELPASLVTAFDRMAQAATTTASAAAAKTGGTGAGGFGAGTAIPPMLDPFKPAPIRPLGSFQTGGAFTVPGSGGGDRPFHINLTPGEHVSVTPPGRKPNQGDTNIENLIVQMRGVDPVRMTNKPSRAQVARNVRSMARS